MREIKPRSPQSGPLKLVKSKQVRPTKKLSIPKDQQHGVLADNACRAKSNLRKAPNSIEEAKQCQSTRLYIDPYDSSSESDPITRDRTLGLDKTPTNFVRRSRYETSMRKRVILNTNGEETVKRKEIIKTLGMEVLESQDRVRASGLNLRGGDPKLNIQNGDVGDDTTSSLEYDSACSSEKSLENKTGWTWTCSTCTETESQQRDSSPLERPSKKSCGDRASNQQASSEVPSIWNSVERITSKSSNHSKGRIGGNKESQTVYQADSGLKVEAKDAEERHHYMSQEQASIQDRYKYEKQRKDINLIHGQESRRQAHAKSVLEISTKVIGPEQFHAEIAWIASAGSTRGPQQILDHKGKNDDEIIKLKIEKLHGEDGIKTKEHGSHNKLKEAVEAVWKTSLGTKGGTENQDMEKELLEHHYCDVNSEESFIVPLCREESAYETVEQKSSAHVDVDDKISAYKKAWRATLGKNNTSQHDNLEKEHSDPVFWCIQRDHENLEALVAREGGFQHEHNDPVVTQVAIDEQSRGTIEQNIPLHEASVGATKGVCRVIPERAELKSKFKVEPEQGALDPLKVQELLHLTKPKFESQEAKVRDERRLQHRTVKGTRENKSLYQEPKITPMPMHTNSGSGKAQLKLMAESKSRIAAEAKASYFEACAEATEKRLHNLLNERNWYYKRFLEEVEYNSDMRRLQHLMELKKANHGYQGQPQKKKMDVRLLVASSVADDALDEENEDGRGALQSGLDDIGSPQSDQEVLQVDTCGNCDRLEFEKWQQEVENNMDERNDFSQEHRGKVEKESSSLKKDVGVIDNICISTALSIPRHEVRDTRKEYITQKNIGKRNEKKRPLSPTNSSRNQDWKPSEFNESEEIENCCVRDQSPFESFGCPQVPDLGAKPSNELEEDIFSVRNSSDNPLYNCAESHTPTSGQPLPLPTQLRQETKIEFRRIMQEQELTWKMAENAVEELGRRLEVLENNKTNLQDIVKSKAMNNVDGMLSRLEKNLEDFPGGFNILYSSPIFEQEIQNGNDTYSAQQKCMSPKLSQISKDYEIQLLKAEIAHLRNEISRSERGLSPQTKDFVTGRYPSHLENIFEGHCSVQEVIAMDLEPSELPDDPFEENQIPTTKEAPRSGKNSPRKVDRLAHYDEFSPIRRVHGLNDSNWSQTPNEEYGARIVTPVVENEEKPGSRQMGYPNSCGQKCNYVEAANGKSNEEHLQATKTVVEKLSEIFSKEEAKAKNLTEENNAPSQSTESRAFYVDLLKRLSEQLAELCHDLYEDEDEDRPSQQVKLMDKKISPTTKAGNMEVSEEQTGEEIETNEITTNYQQPHEVAAAPTEDFQAESSNLRVSLQKAERKMEEELKTNSLLTKQLEYQVKCISELAAENANELERKDQMISYEQQVNKNLIHDMAQTETSLADLRSHNKELVAGLDDRLQVARSEVTSLWNMVQTLKIDLEQKENLESSVKGQRNKTKQQIQDLRSEIKVFQSETGRMVWEKSELVRSIKQTQIEADEQHNRIKEFTGINEDLIAVAHSKENEIKTLQEMVTSLQQSIYENSDETQWLLGGTTRFTQDIIKAKEQGETDHRHHEFLQSKVRETEQELMSREEAMERLTVHLGKTIEGQHFILEEKEKLLLSLNKAHCKEQKLEDEMQYLKIAIQDLEQKLNGMDAEMNGIKVGMEDIEAIRQKASTIEWQMEEMRKRAHQLEEDVMEKEGQISILTSSFPSDF